MEPTARGRIKLMFHPIPLWSSIDIDNLGIDLAKRVFQLYVADRQGHALHGSKVSGWLSLEEIPRALQRIVIENEH